MTISWSHWSQTWPSNMHKSYLRSKLTPPQVKRETPSIDHQLITDRSILDGYKLDHATCKSCSRNQVELTPPQVKKDPLDWPSADYHTLEPGMETEVVYNKLVLKFAKHKKNFLHPQAYNRLPMTSGLKQVFVVKFKCNCTCCFVSFAYVKLKRSATPW